MKQEKKRKKRQWLLKKNDSDWCSKDNGTNSDKPYRVGGMVVLPGGSAQWMCKELLALVKTACLTRS